MPPGDNRQTYALAVELRELGPVGRRDGLDGAGGKGVEGLRQSSQESEKKKDLHIFPPRATPPEPSPAARQNSSTQVRSRSNNHATAGAAEAHRCSSVALHASGCFVS